MKVTARFLKKTKRLSVKKNASVLDVLKELKINPETVLVKKGREIVTEDEPLGSGDEIEIMKVVSGG